MNHVFFRCCVGRKSHIKLQRPNRKKHNNLLCGVQFVIVYQAKKHIIPLNIPLNKLTTLSSSNRVVCENTHTFRLLGNTD